MRILSEAVCHLGQIHRDAALGYTDEVDFWCVARGQCGRPRGGHAAAGVAGNTYRAGATTQFGNSLNGADTVGALSVRPGARAPYALLGPRWSGRAMVHPRCSATLRMGASRMTMLGSDA